MTEKEINDRKLQVQEALSVASLGGKTISEKELMLCEDYVNGKISLEELEVQCDDLAFAGL
ncbi:hypothetical protein [Ileibacterium valens]|uniref:hypothetical protein n=1 Tax=Ileibacterium valens TaxID=1862668 RepID=UPI00272A14FD|nr:hypothetical protein [Ileibacterium valens]